MSLNVSLEHNFASYLSSSLETTYGYPVFQGISDSQKWIPSITVTVEKLEEMIPYTGVYAADCNIIIATQVRTGSLRDASNLPTHSLLAEDVRRVMNDNPAIQTFTNTGSGTCYVYAVEPKLINTDRADNVLINASNYNIVCQIGYATGSISHFQ